MEQLSSGAIRQLLQGAGAQQLAGVDAPSPWARHAPEPLRPEQLRPGHLPASLAAFLPDQQDGGTQPPGGIERRLVRRAEARWANLRGDAALPPATAAAQLLTAPLLGQGMLISVADGMPEMIFAGEALAGLVRIEPGPVRADARPQASLSERLVALALQSLADGRPALLDSDFDTPAAPSRRPHLLMRAIALPFAADPEFGHPGSAAVVASWRKLLSAEETAALHRELAAAMDWMHASQPGGR